MNKFTDADNLRNHQYKTSSNLSARIRIHEQYGTNTYNLHQWAFDMLLATTGSTGRILEIGAGRGDLWARNRDRIPAGWQITLTDFSDGMLADAKTQIGDAGNRFEWQIADAQSLPFDDNTFDAVCAHFMLYHVPDRVKAISEMRRVLKPGGSLHTMTNGEQHMFELYDVAFKHIPEMAADLDSARLGFRLENAESQLKTAFADVQQIVMDSALKVTSVEPLMDYLYSTTRFGDKVDAVRPQLEAFFQHDITEKGHFFIQKASGLFVSRGYAQA